MFFLLLLSLSFSLYSFISLPTVQPGHSHLLADASELMFSPSLIRRHQHLSLGYRPVIRLGLTLVVTKFHEIPS